MTNKQLQTALKRYKETKESFVTDKPMTSKIEEVTVNQLTDGTYDINVSKIKINNKSYTVDFFANVRPLSNSLQIKGNRLLDDGLYTYNRLKGINTYKLWTSHYREILWSIANVFERNL